MPPPVEYNNNEQRVREDAQSAACIMEFALSPLASNVEATAALPNPEEAQLPAPSRTDANHWRIITLAAGP